MASSENIFQAITTIAIFAGIVVLSIKQTGKRTLMFGLIFLVFAFYLFAVTFFLLCSVLWNFSEGSFSNTALSAMNGYGLVLMVFYITNGENVARNFQNFVDLKEILCFCPIPENISFEQVSNKHSKRINYYIKCQFWYNFCIVPIFLVLKILYLLEVFNFENEKSLIYSTYFDHTKIRVVWPILFFQSISMQYLVSILSFNDLYILNIAVFQSLAFKYLRFGLGNIIWFNNSDNQSCKKLLTGHRGNVLNSFCVDNISSETCLFRRDVGLLESWIRNHIELLRLCGEFTKIFRHVLIAYTCNFLLAISIGIFSVTQKQTNFYSLPERLLIGTYCIGNGLCMLFICMSGSRLNDESTNVFDDAFHAPWYNSSKSTKADLCIISAMARRPIRLTPLCSNSGELSLHTFMWVLKAMASFCIALTQVKAAIQVIEE